MDSRHQFTVELFQLSRRWRTRLDERLKPSGHSKASWAVLFWLSRRPEGMTQTELAEVIDVEASTLTRQLDAMERQGLVERLSVAGDRRSKQVRLTADAWQQVEVIGQITESVRAELLDDIDPQELETALSVLQRLHAKLQR